jgi:TolA-binding protein
MDGTGERYRLMGATVLAICALALTAVFVLHDENIPTFIIVMDTMAGGFFFGQVGSTAARNIHRYEETKATAVEAQETAQAVLTDHEQQHQTLQQRLNRMREDIDHIRTGDVAKTIESVETRVKRLESHRHHQNSRPDVLGVVQTSYPTGNEEDE